jgi:hypothetical protein
MSDKEIFELAEKYGDWDDFGRWTFKDDDRLLAFVDAIVRTHTPEDVQKIKSKWVAEPVAWREVVGKTTQYYDYNEDGRGEPLYAAHVHAIDMSQERVDETAKRKHDLWVAAACLKSTVESAIKAGDWKVDGACDPTRDLAYLADCLANPKREWVGLTNKDLQELAAEQHGWESLCGAVEAKLKEKNT